MDDKVDFVGNSLSLGDCVAFIVPNYRSLHTGKIIAFTKYKVRIVYFYCKGAKSNTIERQILQDPYQLVKIK